jgi:hypothetical protein
VNEMKRVAYYKGCLASLSAKELDSATQALAPKVGLELVELESVTCCGAGDIHEAEPDYYLHLNARILSYAAAEGVDTLLTVCNVCTLNLRQANFILLGDSDVRARVNENLVAVGVPAYERDVDVRHLLWEIAARRERAPLSARAAAAPLVLSACRAGRDKRSPVLGLLFVTRTLRVVGELGRRHRRHSQCRRRRRGRRLGPHHRRRQPAAALVAAGVVRDVDAVGADQDLVAAGAQLDPLLHERERRPVEAAVVA